MLPAQLGRAPRHLLVCERGHARHPRSRHEAHVRDHAYSCRVSGASAGPGPRRDPLRDTGREGEGKEKGKGKSELPEAPTPPVPGGSARPPLQGRVAGAPLVPVSVFREAPPSLSELARASRFWGKKQNKGQISLPFEFVVSRGVGITPKFFPSSRSEGAGGVTNQAHHLSKLFTIYTF